MTKSCIVHTDINAITEAQWQVMLESPTASFFQTKTAHHFFENAGIETFQFAIEREDQIMAFVSGIIQKEKGIKSSFTSRAIIYGGPVISKNAADEDVMNILQCMIDYLKKKVIYIETRNLNNYDQYEDLFAKAGFKLVPHLNFHLDCTDSQAMKKRMSSSKLRQVKKSLKSGAEIVEAEICDEIRAYYAILHELYTTKVKTPLPDQDFFLGLWKNNTARFFLIRYENEIIGGIVCPVFENKVIYEWFVCGKDGVYKNIYPSILATWAAMQYATDNNIERFDFMGAGKPDEEYGVREFKSKFGGDLVSHGRFLLVTQPLLYKAGKTAVKILKSI